MLQPVVLSSPVQGYFVTLNWDPRWGKHQPPIITIITSAFLPYFASRTNKGTSVGLLSFEVGNGTLIPVDQVGIYIRNSRFCKFWQIGSLARGHRWRELHWQCHLQTCRSRRLAEVFSNAFHIVSSEHGSSPNFLELFVLGSPSPLSEATMSPNRASKAGRKYSQGFNRRKPTVCGGGDCPAQKAQEKALTGPISERRCGKRLKTPLPKRRDLML